MKEVVDELIKKDATLNIKLLNVLQEAENYRKGIDSLTKCPVCEGDTEKEKVLKIISQQLTLMKDFQDAQRGFIQAKKQREQTEELLKSLIKSFIAELNLFTSNLLTAIEPTDNLIVKVNEIQDKLTDNDKY
ncbi:MAG: hypothetical protein EOO18_10000, partial [Chryseobacterium sp.]